MITKYEDAEKDNKFNCFLWIIFFFVGVAIGLIILRYI